MKNMTEGFRIEQICTASFSPWSNGICEKTVGILKESLRKLKEDGGSNKEIALDWTVNARNTLNMSSGFSSHQLVFGKKPYYTTIENEERKIDVINEAIDNDSEMMKN